MNNLNVHINLSSSDTSTTLTNAPVIIKGQSTVSFVLTSVTEDLNSVLFLDVNYGDGTNVVTFHKDAVFNYHTTSIFYEILYGKIGGSLCIVYPHTYSNITSAYSVCLTASFTFFYTSSSVITVHQPLNIYWGSFYDDVIEVVAINSQIQPLSTNNTFVNFESRGSVQVVPSVLA